jgi:hypothetical protein
LLSALCCSARAGFLSNGVRQGPPNANDVGSRARQKSVWWLICWCWPGLVLVPPALRTRGARLFCPPTAYRLPLTIPNITGCVEHPCRANVRVVEASLRKSPRSPTALPAIIPRRPDCLSSPAPSPIPIAYTLCASLSLGLLLSDYSSYTLRIPCLVACGGPPHPHRPRTHTHDSLHSEGAVIA